MEVKTGFRSAADIARERYSFDEYQAFASRTANGIPEKEDRIENALLGLIGELGELSEPIKHARFHGHPFDLENATEEIGDCAWYAAWICSESNLALSVAAGTNSVTAFQSAFGSVEMPTAEAEKWRRRTEYVFALIGDTERVIRSADVFGLPIEPMRRYLRDLARLASSLDVKLSAALTSNIEKLNSRYPGSGGFSRERSINRKEGLP